MSVGVTLSRHLREEEARHPDMTVELSTLLDQLGFASKILSREIGRAALVGQLGLIGETNPTGDPQKKLDVYGNQIMVEAFARTGLVAGIVSEELEEIKQVTGAESARYVLSIDPVDGSSNTDINGAIGTIFGVYRRTGGSLESDLLRKGSEQVLAGYVMYSTSTMLVYTCGHGVHGFTLDRDLGEFLLSHENIRCPARGKYYSANLGRYQDWEPNIRGCVDWLTQNDPATGRPYSLRYSGALVGDFHRCLLEGGFYFYPPDSSHKQGKLRLLYEAAPLGLIAREAGGRASTGRQDILDVQATDIHQRLPLVIGSAHEVGLYEQFLSRSAAVVT